MTAEKMNNKVIGSSLDDFLKEEGIYEECKARAIKIVIEDLKYGDIVYDNETGEKYKFAQAQFPNVLVFDEKGLAVWLPPERIANE
jgi:hypothetical protein